MSLVFKLVLSDCLKFFGGTAHCLRITHFLILAYSTNFCPIKSDLSGNTVWPQASDFQKLAKTEYFWHFQLTFVLLKCKRSSLRSQCWMRLFLWFSNTVLRFTHLNIYAQVYCNDSYTTSGRIGQRIRTALPNKFQSDLLCAGYEVKSIYVKFNFFQIRFLDYWWRILLGRLWRSTCHLHNWPRRSLLWTSSHCQWWFWKLWQ